MDHTQDLTTSQGLVQMMGPNSQNVDFSMCVLDVLRYDIEPIESIVRLLNDDGCIGWRHLRMSDFTTQDVLPLIRKLVAMGLVDVYETNQDKTELVPVELGKIDIDARIGDYWYLINTAGREAWEDWEPPTEL